MKHQDRAKLLLLREKILLDEAPYIVTPVLGGGYEGALNLLLEAVENRTLLADVKPMANPWNNAIIRAVDPSQTTILIADLTAWVKGKSNLHQPRVVDATSAASKNSDAINQTKPSWIEKARVLAVAEYETAKERGWGHDQESIAKVVETLCDQETSTGGKFLLSEKGKKLSAAYICRHALSPWNIPEIALANRQIQKK